jgi:hypothetical protein
MIKLIKEETITENVTTQIIYREAKIDFQLINSNDENLGNGLFKSKPVSGIKPVYYNKYKCIEGGVNEYRVCIVTEGWVFTNDWYIKPSTGLGHYDDKAKLETFKNENNNGPFIQKYKVVGINKEGYNAIPIITNEQISKIVNIMNCLDTDEEPPTLAVPMTLITINDKLSSETIIANEDGSFPFLTIKDYAIAKELAESAEE